MLALRSSMSDMEWLLDGEDGSSANVGDIVIYNKYVTRTVAVDGSADGAADGLDDQFSMDAEGENGAALEISGASALDAAPVAEDAPAAEPQTTTVTDAKPVETVGIVSSVDSDADTLTVISGDVDGKVAEVTLSNAEVLGVVSVAYAQYADEMLSSAVDGALKAPSMLTMAGEGSAILTSVHYVDYFNETRDTYNGGITKLTFKVDNNEQTGDFDLEFGKAVNAQFDYHVDAGVLSATNKTLTYKLPNGLEPPESKTVTIYNNQKPALEIGYQTFNKDGTTTLTFYPNLDYFDLTKGFDGSFYYDWEHTKAVTGGNKIQFPGGTTVTLKEPQDIKITKSQPSADDGTITEDSDGKTRIHYEVVVSTSQYGWKEPIWIQDGLRGSGGLSENGTLYDPNSFKLVKKDADGKETKIASLPNFERETFDKELDSRFFTGFEYADLPPLKAGEQYVLNYDVLTPTAYTDRALLDNVVNTEGAWDSSQVILVPYSKVAKYGYYNNSTGLIDWVIIIRNPYRADLGGYTVKDTLDNGATIKGDINLYITNPNDGHRLVTENIGGETFNIKFEDSYIATLAAGTKIEVTYSAVVNANAKVDSKENTNEAYLVYGSNHETTHGKTNTNLYQFDLIKYCGTSGKLLGGAQFKLYDAMTGGNKINLVKNEDGTYRVATAAEINGNKTVDYIETVAGKTVKISGLDKKVYYLEETVPPVGYNGLTERVTVDLSTGSKKVTNGYFTDGTYDEASADSIGGVAVVNNAGTILPGTGGIGTTIFYVIGGGLMAAAAILLITKKRMENH